jgi:sensor histidine kinase regulating citrate/malate metabolism
MAGRKGAKVSTLAKLHEKLATVMLNALENPEELKAADLAVMVKFLKDNGIEATEDNEKLQQLKQRTGNVLDFPFDPEREAG